MRESPEFSLQSTVRCIQLDAVGYNEAPAKSALHNVLCMLLLICLLCATKKLQKFESHQTHTGSRCSSLKTGEVMRYLSFPIYFIVVKMVPAYLVAVKLLDVS